MFFKVALRNLLKRKVFAIINISGLGLGLAAFLLIYLYISNEIDYDNFYPSNDRVFRIAREFGVGGDMTASAAVNYKLGDLMRENMADVEQLSRFSTAFELKVEHGDKQFKEKRLHFTDNQFIEIFGLELLKGNKEIALNNPFEVVITQEIAKKIFDNGEALNESINIGDRPYKIVGIVNQMPNNAHLHFDYLMSLESTKSFYSDQMFEHWGNVWIYTYVRLTHNNQTKFEEQLTTMVNANGPPALKDFNVKFITQAVEDIHLKSNLSNEIEQNGDMQLLKILGFAAILILLIACFNFINLTTARSVWRSKEVGVKKVLGVGKNELILQFLGESLFVTMISFLVSMVAIFMSLPFFNYLTGKHIKVGDVLMASPALVFIAIVTGLLAGFIPALFLSSFQPVKVLKGQSQGNSRIANMIRQILVIAQFTISIVLIISALVIFNQLDFIKSKDMGVDIDNVVVVKLNKNTNGEKAQTVINELSQMPDIKSVTLGSNVPFEGLNSWSVQPRGIDAQEELISITAMDENYFNTLQLSLTENTPKDAINQKGIFVNEAFVRHYLISNPIGIQIKISHLKEPLTIVGIIKDYNYASLHESIKPLMLYVYPSWFSMLAIKISDNNYSGTIATIKESWEKTNPGEEFEYYNLEDRFESLYQTEEKTGEMVGYFSFFSILIACMGLYGLAAYVAESKIKEISVRKVLGAKLMGLVQLQFNVFLKLIVVACILAVPLAFYLMNAWLSNFAYHVNVAWWVVALAIIAVMLFTIISVGYRSVMAAYTNPAESLRNE